jgi:hypothetical protein
MKKGDQSRFDYWYWCKLRDRFNLVVISSYNNVLEFKGDRIHGYYSIPYREIRLENKKRWNKGNITFFKNYYKKINEKAKIDTINDTKTCI